MSRFLVILVAASCLLQSAFAESPAAGSAIEEHWMAILIDGTRTGYMHSTREVDGDKVIHTQAMHLTISRSGISMTLETEDRTVETIAGQPLSFESIQSVAGGKVDIRGTVEDDKIHVEIDSGGGVQEQTLDWPDGALMPEGLLRLTEEEGLEKGTEYSAKVFVASSMNAAEMHVSMGDTEVVDLFGVEMPLVRSETVMKIGGAEMPGVSWIDADYAPRRMTMGIMGMQMELVSCPEACAREIGEPAEFFAQTFVHLPDGSPDPDDHPSATYRIRATGDGMLNFPESSEQTVVSNPDGSITVVVRSEERPMMESIAIDDFLKQTPWLQTDSPEVMALAVKARGDSDDPQSTMVRLDSFVRKYVDDKNLSVGYASALDTVRSRSGDCTEHALLLAALGRANGIPTRIATGVAFVDSWLGARDVMVPHAWAQAWIDGRWVSFDAALGRFDAGHLALGYGDGDPWNFYDGVTNLGNFEITAVAVD